METSLPTPMTARVYVNLLEGLEMTVWTHWVHPAIFLTNEATSCHSHTIFMAKSTGNRKWCVSWRQSCPSRICSDQKCQKKTSTRFNKHQKAATNINKHQQEASWASCVLVVSIEHEQKTFPTSPDLGALEDRKCRCFSTRARGPVPGHEVRPLRPTFPLGHRQWIITYMDIWMVVWNMFYFPIYWG